jgi:uncharacterized protein YsxB (DUF464 family)
MTKIIFFKNEYNLFTKLEVKGHTGFAELGNDTLCAAISAIVQTGALGFIQVLNLKETKISRNDKKGYFLVELPSSLNSENLNAAQVIFNTMLAGLTDLSEGYSKFIKLEVK